MEKKKTTRHKDWNYGGSNFRLSRSKIDLFTECPRCFYLDQMCGVKRPQGPAFTLNIAVDELFKKEFDAHRAKGVAHPLMKRYGVDAVPYKHEKIEEWRDALKRGISVFHEPTGLTIRGGIDDVWVNPKGELIIVDYKATSKVIGPTTEADLYDDYKRQAEVYQWLFRKNGYKVSDTAYFVYANGRKDKEAFDGKLEFDVVLIPYKGDDSWVEKTIFEIKKCLDAKALPKPASDCEYCDYRKSALEKALEISRDTIKKSKTKEINEKQAPKNETLF